ncbi:cytochrome c4 [Aquitalea sp. S1-19]|uniref:C-type cytochrome n=1 Tax=Craterilacuibacter sinensis TaxID=2686017 RepID=A0A845BL21_9NEIS|nr:c-type cytochrome [Craterilacuibacter sinensis]MCP9758336.1 cytochrome c4 [Aquitalea sp. S1-19]MXR35984.1 c-type cytochrome [Craterilacuibacter sinensis]RQW28272.1 cytochrome c4 [Rhodobacteraceae bacterium CH30]
MKRKMLLALSAALLAGGSLAAAPTLQADPAKAKVIVEQVCAACHGVDGNSVAAINPTLAGQSQQYLHAQLVAFKAGKRQNPTMLGMASTLSEQDMVNVAAYFSQQKVKPRDASDKTQLELGKQLYRTGNAATKLPACMSCHGPAGAGLPEKYPRLGSQHASYIVKQLQDYKGATVRNNVIMTDIAARMSDAEMKAVAEYISGLR